MKRERNVQSSGWGPSVASLCPAQGRRTGLRRKRTIQCLEDWRTGRSKRPSLSFLSSLFSSNVIKVSVHYTLAPFASFPCLDVLVLPHRPPW